MTIPSGTDRPGDDQTTLPPSLPLPTVIPGTEDSPAGKGEISQAQATESLIERFGGLRPMAGKLEIPVTTIQGWKKRGVVPLNRLADVRIAAQRHEIQLDEAELAVLGWTDALASTAAKSPAAVPTPPGGDLATVAIPPVVIPPAEIPPASISLTTPSLPSASVTSSSPTGEGVPSAATATRATNPRGLNAHANSGRQSGQSGRDAWAVLSVGGAVVALIAAGIAVTAPLWLGPTEVVPQAPAALQTRLGDLETKLSRVALDRGVAPAELEKRVDQLEAALTRVGSDQSTILADLSTRLVALEKGLPMITQKSGGFSPVLPTVTTLLALTALRATLATGSPFQAELVSVELSSSNDPSLYQALQQISERAATGIATADWLSERFPATARAVLRTTTADNPLAGIADQAMGLLSALAPPLYRLTTALDSGSVRSILDHTDAWLMAGDLPRAVEQLSSLSGPAAEAAAPWLAEARARVAAERARAVLGQRAITLLPNGGGSH